MGPGNEAKKLSNSSKCTMGKLNTIYSTYILYHKLHNNPYQYYKSHENLYKHYKSHKNCIMQVLQVTFIN